MENLFNDNAKANTEVREHNITTLKDASFKEGGLYCLSGNLHIAELKTKTSLVFGMRCNVSGKRNKYFSLSKDFKNKEEAITFFKNIKNNLNLNK